MASLIQHVGRRAAESAICSQGSFATIMTYPVRLCPCDTRICCTEVYGNNDSSFSRRVALDGLWRDFASVLHTGLSASKRMENPRLDPSQMPGFSCC